MRNLISMFVLSFVCALTGCIENDIPYPVVELEILGVTGEGFTATIDRLNRKVTLALDETTDISRVRITSVSLTDEAQPSIPLTGILSWYYFRRFTAGGSY